MVVTQEIVARNRAKQIEWYGEPLGDRFHRLLERLDVPQAALADALGLSAPMLSQLMSAHRAKISNPAVFGRLLAIEDLVAASEFDGLSASQVQQRLARLRAETPTTSSGGIAVHAPSAPRQADPVAGMQALLRATASAAEIEDAANLLDASHPELAAVLRVYGNGRTDQAREHFARLVGPA